MAILFFGPLFYFLPKVVLASIIIVAATGAHFSSYRLPKFNISPGLVELEDIFSSTGCAHSSL